MKHFIFFFALIFTLFEYSVSQTKCYPWEEREKSGLNFNELDSIYIDADNIDSTSITAFRGREEQLFEAMKQLLQDISIFLWKNNFKWEKQTRCNNYFFFDKDGTVDFHFFTLKILIKMKNLKN